MTLSVHIGRDHFAEVVVRDDGIGMSPRGDSPGVGLGLSLIERLADETGASATERRRGLRAVGAVSLRRRLRPLPAVPVGTRQPEPARRARHLDWASDPGPEMWRRV